MEERQYFLILCIQSPGHKRARILFRPIVEKPLILSMAQESRVFYRQNDARKALYPIWRFGFMLDRENCAVSGNQEIHISQIITTYQQKGMI